MHSKDHDDSSDRKFRQTLNVTIINNFLDLESVSSSSTTLSSFFHHMRNSFKEIPHIFVTNHSYESNGTLDNAEEQKQQKDEEYLSTAFTEWLLMWLLRVLSQPCALAVHKECKELFLSLLKLVRSNNPFHFRQCIECLISLLSELSTMVDNIDGANSMNIKNYFLSKTTGISEDMSELDLVDISIVFTSSEECESLQEKISSVLGNLITDVTQFLPDKCADLCYIFCLQIELGDLKLKHVSALALTTLIQDHGLIFPISHVNYIFSCLQALISFCCTLEEPFPDEMDQLQESTASCLSEILQNIPKAENKCFLTISTLGKMLQVLLEVVTDKFLNANTSFQTAVIKGIIFFLEHGDQNGYSLPLNMKRNFTQILINLITNYNSKSLVTLVVHLINEEVKCSLYKKEKTLEINQMEVEENANSLNSFENMQNLSEMWAYLYGVLLNKLNAQQLEERLNLELACNSLEILLWSYCAYVCPIKSKLYDIGQPQHLSFKMQFPSYIIDTFNLHVKSFITSSFSSDFKKIVIFYKYLLCMKDLLCLTSEQYMVMCNILSIPWIIEENNFQDLDCELLPVYVVKSLKISVHQSIQLHCLETLILLPSNIAKNWKNQVFISCLNHGRDLSLTAVKILPFYLHSCASPIKQLFEITPSLLKITNVDVLKELARIFGILCCICCNSSTLFRQYSSNCFFEMLPEVCCLICEISGEMDKPLKMSSPFNDCLEELIIFILGHPSELVRRELVLCFDKYFMHYDITTSVLNTTMQYLVDSDPNVRSKFSKIIGHALKPVFRTNKPDSGLPNVEEILIANIQAALVASKQSESLHFQKTVIFSIGEIGKISKGGLLLITIISLLESYMLSLPSVKVVASSKLKEIADSKKLKMHDLLKAYKDAICKFLADFLFSRKPDDTNQVLFILEEIRTMFGYNDVKSFISHTQGSILPYLITRETNSTVVIESVASVLNIDKREILINNFPFIFSHLVRHCSKADLETALEFIQKETGLELGSLLRCHYQPVHNELLLHLSTHYKQVFTGLAILALKSGSLEGSKCMIIHDEEMANYLQPKLLGFLVFFDAHLLKSSLDDKKMALESLISIMKIMGTRAITTVRFKLMATLRLALRFKEGNFPKICCKAWSAFVSSIEISCLGPLLNQIIVALLPLLDMEPTAVAEIFNYLIVEKRSYLSEFYHDLYFMPDTPELKDINAILKDYSESPSSMTDFFSLLCHSIKGISHENLEVRLHALEKLKQVLHSNQKAIHDHLQGRENVDNLLSNLVAALIAGCRESDVRIRTALGDCLGELGAIDPGRLDMKSASSKEKLANFYSNIDDEEFAFALLQELVHSFLAAEQSSIQDCSACAIQEVLKYYKCSNESSSSGNHLWKLFPPDIQEILIVLFHSQYKPLEKSRKKFPVPIYQSKVGSTFKDWTKNWYYSLLQKIKKENPFKLFHACSIIVKYDLNCTLFLLPHLVVYALLDATEIEKNVICTEILTVLRQSEQSSTVSDLCHLSSQTIFSVIDHLTKWTHHYQQEMASRPTNRAAAPKPSQDKSLTAINSCLSSIPQILLAKSSFACQAYARSLMHLEKYIKEFPDQLENHTSFIQKIYARLDDSDGVAGVAAIRKEEPTLMDLILENEATGNMQAAFACYEKAIKLYPDEVSYHGGLLKCFLGMDQPTTAVSYANGILSERPEWKEKLNPYRIEAAWKLASWENLESYLDEAKNKSEWTVGIGNILHLANKEKDSFEKYANIVRSCQMAPLSAASMEKGAYLRGYEYLIRMHILTDLQQGIKSIFNLEEKIDSPAKSAYLFNETLPTLATRWTLVQSSSRYQEPIHDLHRVLLRIGKEKMPDFSTKFDQEIVKCWLQSARLARKNEYHQRAYSCLLEASTINSADFFMEKTKWLWSKGEKEQAIYCLQKGINEHFSSLPFAKASSSNLSTDDKLMFAKAKLLLAVYSEESSIVDSSSLIEMYKEVVNLQPDWEASHFHLAKYYDKMLSTTEVLDARAEIMVKVVRNFAMSLQNGCKNVYHSLPRLLDIWFDLGTVQLGDSSSSSKQKATPASCKPVLLSLQKISTLVQSLSENIPLYLFLTAFPQLVSRICHSHPCIAAPLQKLISRLLVSYPQQSMWMMMAVSKSSYQTRSKRCRQIFHDAILVNPSLGKYINDTTRLADKLMELANKNTGEAHNLSLSENFTSLLKLMDDRNFSQVMLPLQTQMIVTLPNGFINNSQHNPFPMTHVYIMGFEDKVDVFSSLQKPKKVIVRGSDGKLYPVMCKPKDDLRKDCRLMEFNNLVNRYLKSDPEARRRQLYIRTYAVIPLNEDCGLIEWVPNLHGLRLILQKIYKLKNQIVNGREIKAMMPAKTATFEEKLHIFKSKFLPRFPPVFHEWFKIVFSDPTAWYHARLAYARTTAVMSMVGYIVGLGDRHGENILFDSSCGDTVHVDLNCLFNRGETFDCPECVPFRLTHNMVDAMGPTGYEGAFRKACEVTMRVMRSRTDALMSVLRPFVHDPLVEWSRSKHSKAQHDTGEITNEQGLTHVKDIELRLNGIIKYKNKQQGLPLSIEGQVNHLIQEAVDLKNLSQMYIGWAAYM
ncbi:hypothetical protein JTE90_019718 [Oedothorax gibbosus]|uniref:Serine/threonine-protein kinase ATR n=1 Tax=Oedothorax gibbosus TaxID=931172 RepID=A0AAV6UMT3_9ARAC|nr:hypothetical protein JTE90_019718 [Oedothorax gibbosus]